MQALLEIVAAIVIWAASAVVSQLGIEVDLSRPPAREAPTGPETAAETPAENPCPDSAKARIRRV